MVSGRSPAYPFIDLERAVELIHKIHSVAKGHPVTTESLMKQIGFKGMTGSTKKMLAALKYFGLVDQPHGSKDTKLSERALHIIHGVIDSHEQKQAIKDAFLSPSIYVYCWETWKDDDISDELMKSHLILKKGFNDSTVMGFISSYKQSRDFAGMIQSDETSVNNGDAITLKIGDWVQWESQGVLQFQEPKQVKGIFSEDGYLTVDGSDVGIPINEVEVVDPPVNDLNTPPPSTGNSTIQPLTKSVNMRQETFALEKSDIVIQFPASMSKADFEDFSDWLEILRRKVSRTIVEDKKHDGGLQEEA